MSALLNSFAPTTAKIISVLADLAQAGRDYVATMEGSSPIELQQKAKRRLDYLSNQARELGDGQPMKALEGLAADLNAERAQFRAFYAKKRAQHRADRLPAGATM